MSHQEDKDKHSKRIHSKETAVEKQVKIAKAYGMTGTKEMKQPHRLVKHHALDCGNPKCMMCGNPRKTFKELTVQEKRAMQEMDIARMRHSNGNIEED